MDRKIKLLVYDHTTKNARRVWRSTQQVTQLIRFFCVYDTLSLVQEIQKIPNYADVTYEKPPMIHGVPVPPYTALVFTSDEQYMQFCMEYL